MRVTKVCCKHHVSQACHALDVCGSSISRQILSGTAVISMQDDEAAVQGVFGLPNKEPMAILE